ncbi:Protein phosphatase 2C [Spironucleus salmonicida]|uniref:Protein phosphatase 2C n=1 Tax=Spironucleus salmonicida TaxID=348837 RepID=V6LUM2_9EUKA|nr:Protein phosphatase 2C [Spironucleus salmonicida]|eukprot:EST47958.1 Protein phosphatase 2C [Spironucleus salmonicida]
MPTFNFGASTTTGRRPSNEDAHTITHLNSKLPCQFVAVYDGHGGASAACYASTTLHTILQAQKTFPDDIKKSFITAFTTTDKNYIKQENSSDIFSSAGCTACACLLTPTHAYFANAGDARAIISKNDQIVQITTDHKPSLPSERARIEQFGSCVVEQPGDCPRVAGMLAVSRAIGDAPFKGCGVVALPDVFSEELQGVDFIVLACDGVWDVLTNEEVQQIVKICLKMPGNASSVREKILKQGVEKLLESTNFRDNACREAEQILVQLAESVSAPANDLTCNLKTEIEKMSPAHLARMICKVAVCVGSDDNISCVVGVERAVYEKK